MAPLYGYLARLFHPAKAMMQTPSAMQLSSSLPCRSCVQHQPATLFVPMFTVILSSHVFVQHYATRTPLQQPYYGPYRVIKRSDKYFILDISGRQDMVSVDRLKPELPPTTSHASPMTPTIPQEPTHNHNSLGTGCP